jgi:hypothetical protein
LLFGVVLTLDIPFVLSVFEINSVLQRKIKVCVMNGSFVRKGGGDGDEEMNERV